MSTPPPAKRPRTANSGPSSPLKSADLLPSIQASVAPRTELNTVPPPLPPVSNPRKRHATRSPVTETRPLDTRPPPVSSGESSTIANMSIPALLSESPETAKKRNRTNTPWTAAEEQRLKQMRDAGNTWNEIAKAFPNRTEGSVKKHWYKDMHYAEFAEDETKALLEAIREYDTNKWKVIGTKLGKPAKACEQFAKDHFSKNT